MLTGKSKMDFFRDFLKEFGFQLGDSYTLKEIIISIQKQNGVLKKIIGCNAPSGFDFSNESLYTDPSLRRVFSNILIENENTEDFNRIISNINEIYILQKVDIIFSTTFVEITIFASREPNGTHEQIVFFSYF